MDYGPRCTFKVDQKKWVSEWVSRVLWDIKLSHSHSVSTWHIMVILETVFPGELALVLTTRTKQTEENTPKMQNTRFIVNAKHKIQGLIKHFQGPKYACSSTDITDKNPHPRHVLQNLTLQCDTLVYCTVFISTVTIKAGDRQSQWWVRICTNYGNATAI